MNIYELSRSFWDFSFENPEKIKPNHISMYFFAIEHCNRLGWKEKFGFPTTMVMEAIGIKSYNTFINTLNELIDFGFIKMIEKSKNQYSSNIISISKKSKKHSDSLDSALTKHHLCSIKKCESTVQSIGESTVQSNDSINKQVYNNTLITQVEPEGFDSLHFVIAKMFHSLFVKLRGENDTLKKVKTESYVETIRLMLNVDKRSVTQLAALKLYLEDSKKEGSKLNPFWADTIFSLKAFREKSKSGVHRWDLICLELKKWQSIEGNYQRATKLAETINQKSKEYDRIQEGL